MSSGGRDARHAPTRASRLVRWLPAAALAAIALLVALWIGRTHDTDAASGGARSGAPAANPSLDANADGAPHVTGPQAPTPNSAPLASGRASLTLRVEDTGAVASRPLVRMTRTATGDHEVRDLGSLLAQTWPDLPAGDYTLEVLGDAWSVDEPAITLASGELRTVTVSARRTAVVRVVGGLTGKPVPVTTAFLNARVEPDGAELPIMMPLSVSSADGRFALLGVPSVTQNGQVIRELSVQAGTRQDGLNDSDWISLAALAATPVITVRAPEVFAVGHVVRAQGDAADDAGLDDESRRKWVELRPLDDAPDQRAGGNTTSGTRVQVALLDRLAAEYVDDSGAYELKLSAPPTVPVHLVAKSRVDATADSGPLTLPAGGAALHVDLVLPASGRVRGSVHVAVGTSAEGETAPLLRIETVGTYSLAATSADGARTWQEGVVDDDADDAEAGTLHFLIGGLSAGDYEVEVLLRPEDSFAEGVAARRLSQHVSVPAGAAVPLELDATAPGTGATVSGTLRRPPDLSAADVTVSLYTTGQAPDAQRWWDETSADSSGRFAFADVPPGHYSFRVYAGSNRSKAAAAFGQVDVEHADVTVPPVDLTRTELHLHAAGKGARSLGITDLQDRNYVGVQADKSGNASVFGLAPGRYHVRAESGPPVEFEIAAEGSATVEVP